jgi:hypothetical protein
VTRAGVGLVQVLAVRPEWVDLTLSTSQVARQLGVHPNTVKRLSPFILPYFRVGTRGDRRYRLEDVEAYIVRGRTTVTEEELITAGLGQGPATGVPLEVHEELRAIRAELDVVRELLELVVAELELRRPEEAQP